MAGRLEGRPTGRVLYLSPLKALNYDVERNLRGPLAGIAAAAERAGIAAPEVSVAVRTGDTPQRDRQRMLRTPPDVLITTPESLFLLLTSRGRDVLAGVRSVIVDEIHAVAATKRGTHLALSLERLERVVAEDGGSLQRIGLSATQRPLSEIARFLGGQDGEGRPRPVTIVDAGAAKELDLRVIVPVEDMRELGTGAPPLEPDVAELVEGEARTRSIWPAMYPELLELVRPHRSTLIFVNNRRLAERLALRLNELADEEVARAHHGSLAREQRTLIEEQLKAGRAARAGRHQQPGARHRHGRGGPGDPGREPAQRGARHAAHRPRRAPGGRAQPRAHLPQVPRRPARVRGGGRRGCGAARSRRRACRGCRSTCWPSRSWP